MSVGCSPYSTRRQATINASRRTTAALYLRVSTDGQTTVNQERELRSAAETKGWTVTEVYRDAGVSGAKAREERPGLHKAIREAVQGRYSVLMAWSVDRLGRSLPDLLSTLQELHGAGVDLFLHQQAIDTRTPSGKAMFSMLGIFAEFERAMIVDRVKAGLRRAVAQGTVLGRPRVDASVERSVMQLRKRGLGMLKISKTLGIGTGTVQRVVAEQKQAD